jgi:hypothetical protein
MARFAVRAGTGGRVKRTTLREAVRRALRRAGKAASEVFYGMTTFEWAREMRRGRAEAQALFLLIAFGDLVGLPILPPYYSLRLLPFIVPVLGSWKRSLLRERDWSDLIALIQGAE